MNYQAAKAAMLKGRVVEATVDGEVIRLRMDTGWGEPQLVRELGGADDIPNYQPSDEAIKSQDWRIVR